jgi:hypothetical protein
MYMSCECLCAFTCCMLTCIITHHHGLACPGLALLSTPHNPIQTMSLRHPHFLHSYILCMAFDTCSSDPRLHPGPLWATTLGSPSGHRNFAFVTSFSIYISIDIYPYIWRYMVPAGANPLFPLQNSVLSRVRLPQTHRLPCNCACHRSPVSSSPVVRPHRRRLLCSGSHGMQLCVPSTMSRHYLSLGYKPCITTRLGHILRPMASGSDRPTGKPMVAVSVSHCTILAAITEQY